MRSIFIVSFGFAALIFSSIPCFPLSKVPTAEEIPLKIEIGVRTLRYEDETRQRPVLVELWYPTETEGPYEESSDLVWVHPKEIRNVSLSKQKSRYPLIVMSHGNRGDRRDRSWMAEFLVKQGYVVASVEHHGNTWSTYNPITSLRFWERARDISFVLDRLGIEPFLQDRIDEKRIGFIGYSLGGMTGLALAGAVAQNVKEIVFKEAEKHSGATPEILEQIDFSEGQKSFAERRIRAFVLICPAIFVYPPQSLAKIKVPVGLIASLHDEVLPHSKHAYQIIKHLTPAKLKLIRDKVSHFAFLNRVTEKGKKIMERALPYTSRPEPLHDEVSRFIADFFKEYLPQ